MEPIVEVSEDLVPKQAAVTTADEISSATGRRRPGRLETVSPNLLPLLRKAERELLPVLPEDSPSAPSSDTETIELPFSRYESPTVWFSEGEGTALGVIIGTLLWAGIGSGMWAFFKYLL